MTLTFVQENLIDLGGLERVARGRNRDIYFLPSGLVGQAEPLILKVPRYSDRNRRQGFLKRAVYRLWPGSQRRVISNEARYAQKLATRLKSHSVKVPIPAFCGFVRTSGGPGALWEAVCNAHGAVAPTLANIAMAGQIQAMAEPLNRFARTCYALNLVAPDINDRNLAVRGENASAELVLVDGFGDHRVISLREIWPARNIRCLDDRFRKVARKTGLTYDAGTRRFSLPG
ncbi:MAG: YrbL family protein [Roseobacter sp.]|jgi:hypothetical protein